MARDRIGRALARLAQDVEDELTEGAELLEEAVGRLRKAEQRLRWLDATATLRSKLNEVDAIAEYVRSEMPAALTKKLSPPEASRGTAMVQHVDAEKLAEVRAAKEEADDAA